MPSERGERPVREGFRSDEEFASESSTFSTRGGQAFGSEARPAFGAFAGGSQRGGSLGVSVAGAAADEAAAQADDSDELSGTSDAYGAARAAADLMSRRRERGCGDAVPVEGDAGAKAAEDAGRASFPEPRPPAQDQPSQEGRRRASLGGRAQRKGSVAKKAKDTDALEKAQQTANWNASRAAAEAGAEAAAAKTAETGAGAVVGTAGGAPIAAGIAAALIVFVLAALALSSLMGGITGFWEDERSRASLAGLPLYITYEMVEAALECQEEYGHPAGCTLAQIIVESGMGDHMSQLAERDSNLFGIKWAPSFALCPEVAGKASWATSEEYGGQMVTVMADFAVFKSPTDCIRFRSRVLLANSRYADNPLIREAVEKHDSDKMAEGLKDAGYATSSTYVDSLKAAMETYGLYRFDGMSLEDFQSQTASGNVIVAAAYSQLGVPYVWGGETPGKGLDCSGLTQYCYAQAGIRISHYTETQLQELTAIPLSQAQPGDILYKYGHVAIFIGDDKYIHEPQPGDVCRIASGISYFTCALRYTG